MAGALWFEREFINHSEEGGEEFVSRFIIVSLEGRIYGKKPTSVALFNSSIVPFLGLFGAPSAQGARKFGKPGKGLAQAVRSACPIPYH